MISEKSFILFIFKKLKLYLERPAVHSWKSPLEGNIIRSLGYTGHVNLLLRYDMAGSQYVWERRSQFTLERRDWTQGARREYYRACVASKRCKDNA